MCVDSMRLKNFGTLILWAEWTSEHWFFRHGWIQISLFCNATCLKKDTTFCTEVYFMDELNAQNKL